MDYDSQQSSGNKHASSFEQRYSLLYSTGARLGTTGRGYYLINAGYEWAATGPLARRAGSSRQSGSTPTTTLSRAGSSDVFNFGR